MTITEVRERPIIFSTEMVKAILDGRKTQTRRVVNKYTSFIGEGGDWSKFYWDGSAEHIPVCFCAKCTGHEPEKAPLPFIDGRPTEYAPYEHQYLHVPYRWEENATIYRLYPRWDVGDRLWVREAFWHPPDYGRKSPVVYRANLDDDAASRHTWKPAIHMPKWAARIWLEITGIRVELLQDITDRDADAEGFYDSSDAMRSVFRFMWKWEELNAKRGYGWETDPWVWVIEFKHIER